jgi:hypothetical protein
MSVNFHSHEYFEFVREEWAQHHEMVVITSDDGCVRHATSMSFCRECLADLRSGLVLRWESSHLFPRLWLGV